MVGLLKPFEGAILVMWLVRLALMKLRGSIGLLFTTVFGWAALDRGLKAVEFFFPIPQSKKK